MLVDNEHREIGIGAPSKEETLELGRNETSLTDSHGLSHFLSLFPDPEFFSRLINKLIPVLRIYIQTF